MKQKRIVIVCLDEEYIQSLEYKLTEAFGADNRVEFITDYEYFRDFLGSFQEIDLLLVQEDLYREAVAGQSLKEVYLLTENEDKAGLEKGGQRYIYKYSSIRKMLDVMDAHFQDRPGAGGQENTKLVSVYSVNGGSGKTTVSVGIAAALAADGFKVLYMNSECFQDYRLLLGDRDVMPNEIGYRYALDSERIFQEMSAYMKQDAFEYFPPFRKPLASYQITPEAIFKQVEEICKQKKYDYLILELSSEMNQKKMEILKKSARIVLVTLQHAHAVEKLQLLTDELTELPGQCVLLCNRFDAGKEDCLKDSSAAKRYEISEYVTEQEVSLQDIRRKQLFKRTAVAIR